MKLIGLLSLPVVLCVSSTAASSESKSDGTGEAAQTVKLVRMLDAIRLPTTSFTVEVKATEQRNGESPREMSFRLYGKPFASASSHRFASLVIMQEPAGDRNKLILMKEAKVWFYDPRSKNATVLSARQMWQHSFAADAMTVRIEDQYLPRLVGDESIETLDDGDKHCVVVELTPQGKAMTASDSVRYWLSTQGRPYQSVYYSASGKVVRTCRFGGYANVLGAVRPTRLAVVDVRGSSTFRFFNYQAEELPDSIFDPANLPRLRLQAAPKQ